jgi:hypothetical protein
MKYASEMGSGAMLCVPSFIKIGSDIQKLIGGTHRHTYSTEIAGNYFSVCQTKESRLKMCQTICRNLICGNPKNAQGAQF